MKNNELRKNVLFNLFNQLQNDLLWIEFIGGEPFLRPDIVDLLQYVYNKTSIVAGSVSTNGILVNKIINDVKLVAEKIPQDKNLTVGVSIDGIDSVYQDVRGIDGFKNAINCFLRLKKLSKKYRNVTPHILYTISQYNAGLFSQFFEYIWDNYKIPIEDFSFTIEHFAPFFYNNESNRRKAFINECLTDVSYILKRKSFLRSFLTAGNNFELFYLRNIHNYLKNPNKMLISCMASRASAYIDPYGNVYPCIIWPVKLGNIKHETIYKIWNTDLVNRLRQDILKQECPNCWVPCEARPSIMKNFGLLLRGIIGF